MGHQLLWIIAMWMAFCPLVVGLMTIITVSTHKLLVRYDGVVSVAIGIVWGSLRFGAQYLIVWSSNMGLPVLVPIVVLYAVVGKLMLVKADRLSDWTKPPNAQIQETTQMQETDEKHESTSDTISV